MARIQALWETDRDMMPVIRRLADHAEREGKPVTRIDSVEERDRFTAAL